MRPGDAAADAVMSALGYARSKRGVFMRTRPRNFYVVEAFDPSGNLKWQDVIENLVVNEGLDDLLDKYFKGSAYTAQHYCGLTSGSPTFASGDTMLTHPGWTEVTAYNEAARPGFVPGAVASQSVDNSASKAVFSINANGTVLGGAFLTTNNSKGGTTGLLYGGAPFSAGNKTLDNGDTLNLQVTASMSSV